MLLHVQVAPIRCRLVLAGAVVAGALSATSRDAHACGATPVEVQPLLPLDGATNVPLNAVLLSSSNLSEAVFELHEVLDDASDAADPAIAAPAVDAGANPASDAGPSGAVQLSVDCSARGRDGGAMCLARPSEPLKPNTRYAWRTNVVVPDGYEPAYFEGLSREFTTGSAIDDEPVAADAVGLTVTQEHHNTDWDGSGCGFYHWMDVAYSLRASEPVVLHFAAYTPSYVMHATLLGGGSGAAATATLYSPPDCLAPIVYDVAGHRTALPEWCPSDGPSPPRAVDEDASEAPSADAPPNSNPNPNAPAVAARRERPLCTLSMPPSPASRVLPAAAALGLALLLADRRRRRS
jgi:hypothetical protein